MGSLRDELAADYAEAIGGYEQTFEWEGESFACVRTTDVAGLTLRPGGGGFEEQDITDRITASLPLVLANGVVLTDLSAPVVGDLLDGYSLQVKRVDPNVGQLVLWAGPPDGGGASE